MLHFPSAGLQDKNPNGAEKFKKVSEAYEVLRATRSLPGCSGTGASAMTRWCGSSHALDHTCCPLQVLSDPEKRKVFDMFGEEGLKGGMPSGAGPSGSSGGSFHGFSGFNPRSPDDIFREVGGLSQNQKSRRLCRPQL